jgi:hypothetical protein
MASPHVAALAALLLGQKPSRTPADVRTLIAQTAEKITASGVAGSYGTDPYGTCSCTWHPRYGYGQIDVAAALGAEPVNPRLTAVSASSAAAGSTITITGVNLTGATKVALYGVSAAFTVDSATQITATVPTIGVPAAHWKVTTPGGTAAWDPNFTVTPPPAPSVTSLSASSGAVGSRITITGTNFTGATAVQLYGINAAFTIDSATQITATVPAIGVPAARWRVVSPSGTGLYDSAFTVTAPPPPSVSSLSASGGAVGSQITINGAGFVGVTAVQLYGINAAFTVLSSTQIRATIPSIGVPAARWRVVLGSTTVLYDSTFTVTPAPAPSITSISTMSASVGAQVTITGTNFTGVTAVQLYGINATFTVLSATQIRATVPVIGVPAARWRVITPGGTAIYDSAFTVMP